MESEVQHGRMKIFYMAIQFPVSLKSFPHCLTNCRKLDFGGGGFSNPFCAVEIKKNIAHDMYIQ